MSFSEGWASFVNRSGLEELIVFVSASGMAFAIMGVFMLVVNKRAGRAGSGSSVIVIALGLTLAGPGIFIPMLLKILDALIPGSEKAVKSVGNGGKSHSPDPSPSSKPPEKKPEPTVSDTPTPHHDPVHVNWEIVGLVAGIVIAAAVLGLLIWYMIRRLRPGLDESKKEREHRAELQRDLDAKHADALASHKKADTQWHAYETDLDAILKAPLMRNLDDPAVAEAIRAKGRADSLRTERAPRLAKGAQSIEPGMEYANAVADYEQALRAAQQKATMRGLDDFDEDEQRDIERARQLLSMALNPGSSESERQVSYDRVVKIVSGLRKMSIPKEAYRKIELSSGVVTAGLIEAPDGIFDEPEQSEATSVDARV